MTPDRVTATPADAARYERAHGPEWHRNEDAENDGDFTMRAHVIDCGRCEQPSCLRCACRRVFGEPA